MDVTLLRWPEEEGRRTRISREGAPRLLLVPDGEEPPAVGDCLEDWIRVPADEEEVRARVDALSLRTLAHLADGSRPPEPPAAPVAEPDGQPDTRSERPADWGLARRPAAGPLRARRSPPTGLTGRGGTRRPGSGAGHTQPATSRRARVVAAGGAPDPHTIGRVPTERRPPALKP